jgi:hypothetical protein
MGRTGKRPLTSGETALSVRFVSTGRMDRITVEMLEVTSCKPAYFSFINSN